MERNARMLLQGVRIVSFCHFLQGPAAAQYLADMGADVIKVEPIGGAYERHWSGAKVEIGGVGGFFLAANRNKRSIGLDLKNEDGRRAARRLIASSDVVMENFRPGVFERLGFGWDALCAIKADIIYASATGYGASGPLAEQPGQDLLIQARSGLMAVTGNPAHGPTPVGLAAIDQHGAALLALGIAGALVRRLREGVGTRIEASLLNAGLDLQTEPLVNWLSGRMDKSRLARQENLASWYHQAPYGVYRTSDDRWIAISINDANALAETLDDAVLRALTDVDTFDERDRYAAAVAEAVGRYSFAELARRFDAHRLWWAPVQDYDEVACDPQVAHNRILERVEVNGETATLVNHPNRYDGKVPPVRVIATKIGQHSREILAELGYEVAEIERLIATRAVAAPPSRRQEIL
jgi:crotonobetainyl-CoA:carnitine CoA-transferase CaiB-like acyl-CoA transferase